MAEGSTDISAAISRANSNLSKVKLRESGGKLYMRGIFPPKPGQKEAKRSELTTGCNATPAGLKIAVEKAKQVDAALLLGKFDWAPYLQGKLKSYKPAQTVKEWTEKYEQDFWKENPRTPNKEGYYYHTFKLSFNRLPQNEPLTFEVLETVLIDPEQAAPASRMRQTLLLPTAPLPPLLDCRNRS